MTREAQRDDALRRANAKRLQKAELKRHLGALAYNDALRHLADLIEADDPIALCCRLAEALTACRKTGSVGAAKFVAHIGATTGDRFIRDLSERQGTKLIAALRDPRSLGVYGSHAGERPRYRRPAQPRPRVVTALRPTPDAAQALWAAIADHHHAVNSPSAPAEAFATADADLWAAAGRIMGRNLGRRKAAA